jgi:FkbM family methyltransferase
MRLADRRLSVLELRASGLELREEPTFEERLVLRHLGWALRVPGTVVYDIGAATGVYTEALAKVASVAQVVAFEPLAESFRALEEHVGGRPNVRCFNLALGDAQSRLKLHRSAWSNTSSFLPTGELIKAEFPLAAHLDGVEEVAVARLDDVVAEHGLRLPDLVKIDVQGFEDRVVRGAQKTLRAARVCVVEVSFQSLYDGSPLFDDVYELMRQLGFRLTGLSDSLRGSAGELLQADAIFQSASGQSM